MNFNFEIYSLIPKIINGGIAGIAGIASVYPLDLVKVRLQNQTIGPNGEKQYKNMYVLKYSLSLLSKYCIKLMDENFSQRSQW